MVVSTEETSVASFSLGSSVVAGSSSVAQVVRDVAQAEPCVIALDGANLLAAVRPVFERDELLSAISDLTVDPMPTQALFVSETLRDIVARVVGVVAAEWASDHESIEVVPAEGIDRFGLLLEIDNALRAVIGEQADSVTVALQ